MNSYINTTNLIEQLRASSASKAHFVRQNQANSRKQSNSYVFMILSKVCVTVCDRENVSNIAHFAHHTRLHSAPVGDNFINMQNINNNTGNI